MTNVLVTGSNGQLASCIKDLANQYKNLNFIYTDYQELDICDLKQLNTFFKSNLKIDYCINCAAYTAVDKAESEVEKAFEINATGPKNLAIVCSKFDTILIQISTDFVFDGEKKEPYTETDVANPISVYGATKLQGEVEIKQLLEKYFIFRTSWLYSQHGTNFMKTMLKLSEIHDEISVVSDQIGSPTYAGDLAKLILKIVSTKNTNFGLYHYSNEGVVSWYDFAKAIFEASDIEIKLTRIKTVDYPTHAKRPQYSVMDTKKAHDSFSVKTFSFKQSLKRLIKSL